MKITIQTNSGVHSFDCEPDENLLYAGLRHGLTLPHDCATGTCGTCRGRVVDGDVRLLWEEAPGLKFCKREKGDVIMCQSVASGDCVLRVPSNTVGVLEGFAVPAYCHGTIGNVRTLTHDVIDFDMTLDAPMRFAAGQFVVFEVPGLTGRRAYSMVNYAEETRTLSFVVKRKPEGGFSDWLFDTEVNGATVKVFGPLGRATFHPEEDKNFVCIGGGSGIAGMMSIVARASRERYFDGRKGFVFFGVRTLADCFYLKRLSEAVVDGGGDLEVTIALSDEPAPGATHPDLPALKLAEGFVHEAASRAMAGRYDNLIGYVAGPEPMVDAARKVLAREGQIPSADIRYDKFS
ncbi:MAG: 2Fe-2S iron-sulfur cluster-binding protein [Methyloligellaceae bacterium]